LWSGTFAGTASDNSGYYLNATAAVRPSAVVTAPNGAESLNPLNTMADTNGNYITVSGTNWTDSVGNIAAKIISGSGSTQFQFLDGSGNYQTITLKYQSYSIKTNFACSGVTEYTGTANLPYELDIPSPVSGMLTYTFSYEPTPGLSGYYTGRLQQVTLPTGGYYEYTYPGMNDSIRCSDGTTLSMNRLVSDGTNSATWNFVRNTSNNTTTVTNPQLPDTPNANAIVYSFNSLGQETQQQIYATTTTSGTPLRNVQPAWATNGTPQSVTTWLEDNTTHSAVNTTYDSNGLLDSMTEYDWGMQPIRTTTYTYQTSSNYTTRNILNLVTSKVIKDGGGTIRYRQDTTYDGNTITNCPTGVLQHDDTDYPCSMNYRGNPTSVTTYLDPVTPGNPITKYFTYDVFGNLLTAQLNCCQSKTWTYSATTQYSLPDSITSGTSPALTTTCTYNPYTGLMTKVTDPNSLSTSYSYDFLRRTTGVSQANGSTPGLSASFAYNDTTFTTTTTSTIDSTKSVQQITATDGLGRAITSTTEDAGNAVYSIVAEKYDLFGRAYSTSNPYTGSSTDCWTTTQFDVLGRPISITAPSPDASVTNFVYAEQYVTATDSAGKQRKSQMDGAGRLYKLFEPDINNNNSLTTQYTTYAYNIFDELTTVTQGAQTRSYVYDALGRLNSSTTPEAGTVCLGTYSGSNCQANGYDNFDNLLYRTDARGVVTSYGYDGLNRLSSVSYNVSGATGVPATSTVSFSYGLTSSCTTAHGTGCIGQLITLSDGVGSENYSYNALEQMTQLQKVIGTSTYPTSYAYNLAGELTQITYPSGRVVQQSVDTIGRLCEIAPSTTGCGTASSPYATGFAYTAANQTQGFKYGNGIFASFGFSSDRLQLNCLDYSTTNRSGNCTHDSTSKFSLAYSYGAAGSNNGQISSITDNVDNGRSATYTYDPLYRLSIATTAGSVNYAAWGLNETYDRYGNRSAQGVNSGCTGITCPTNSVTPDPATNRIIGDCYDANGNLLAQSAPPCPSPTYTYDAENRAVSYLSAAYTYDGNSLRVKKVSGGTTTVYIFSGSKVIAEYDNGALVGSPSREYIYAGAALLAKIDSSGTKYYHQDHLSNRLVTDTSGNTFAQLGHFPFGEQWYNTAGDKLVFTSYERDSESGNDYAMARYYISPLGRFSSPDPLSGNISNPQSLNRYLYTRDDPANFVDPTGLNRQMNLCPSGVDCSSWYGGSGGGWEAGLLEFAFMNTGAPDDPSFDNLDVLDLLGGLPGSIPPLSQCPLCGPLPQPPKPVDPIWNALTKLQKLLANDPDCLSFLNSAGIDAMGRLAAIMDGYYGQAGMLPKKGDNGNLMMTNAVSFGYPGQLVTVNTVGAFFAGQIGSITNSTDRHRIPGGTPSAQGFIMLHELGHNTNVLADDAGKQSIVDVNDIKLEKNCSKTIKAFSN